jgi:uncharacterized protein (TIGR03546 family)
MFWLQIVSNFIKILREGQTPAQVAGGFALGSIVGLSPAFTLQGLVVWFIILVLDVNLSAALLSFTLFALLGVLLDPVFHQLGYVLLVDLPGLKAFWTSLYNAPIAPLTRFNNTIVLGSLVGGIVLALPVFFAMRSFVVAYRLHIGKRVAQWKIYQIVSKSSLVRWYQKVRSLGGLS